MSKLPVGILGATGMVGQQYVQLLADHPWFEVAFLASSEHSAGKTYSQALLGRSHLKPKLERFKDTLVHSVEEICEAKGACAFVFSAMSTEGAALYEERYAASGLPVLSNAGYHRMSPDIPVLIPEINASHAHIIPQQQKSRGWQKGFIAVKPNCSLQSYLIPLFPLHQRYRIKRLIVTTLQAISGAGYPGIASMNILDNVIPHIPHEEEKSEAEPLKILGEIRGNAIHSASGIAIAAHCNRVPVIDGHMACVSVEFEEKPKLQDILALWKNFPGLPQLPSAPPVPILYCEEQDRPQPRLDREAGSGMAVTVGRLRDCPVFDIRFVALSHNTIRGAAGGGILNAELLHNLKYL